MALFLKSCKWASIFHIQLNDKHLSHNDFLGLQSSFSFLSFFLSWEWHISVTCWGLLFESFPVIDFWDGIIASGQLPLFIAFGVSCLSPQSVIILLKHVPLPSTGTKSSIFPASSSKLLIHWRLLLSATVGLDFQQRWFASCQLCISLTYCIVNIFSIQVNSKVMSSTTFTAGSLGREVITGKVDTTWTDNWENDCQ